MDHPDVAQVARIARLHITPEEAARLEQDLQAILDAFRVLEQAPVEGVPPSFQPIPLENVTRQDQVEPSLPREQALKNAKHQQDGYFLGPASL